MKVAKVYNKEVERSSSGVFIANFEHIHLSFRVLLLLSFGILEQLNKVVVFLWYIILIKVGVIFLHLL